MNSLKTVKTHRSSASRWWPSILFSVLAVTSTSIAIADDPGGDSGGGDPTVGTLPLTGGEGVDFDQTVTLRGATELIRAVIVDAGGHGGVEVIDLGSGEAWVRFYGDISLELDLTLLSRLELGIFGGFEGGGTAFAIETAGGVGAPFGLESGFSLDVEVDRLVTEGLIDDTVEIHAYHRCGRRTFTQLDLSPAGDTLRIQQQL